MSKKSTKQTIGLTTSSNCLDLDRFQLMVPFLMLTKHKSMKPQRLTIVLHSCNGFPVMSRHLLLQRLVALSASGTTVIGNGTFYGNENIITLALQNLNNENFCVYFSLLYEHLRKQKKSL